MARWLCLKPAHFMFDNATIEIRFETPDGKVHRTAITLDRDIYRKSFAPLPSTREIPWEVQAQAQAYEQTRFRQHLVKAIGHDLAEAFLKIVEDQDTVNGYPK